MRRYLILLVTLALALSACSPQATEVPSDAPIQAEESATSESEPAATGAATETAEPESLDTAWLSQDPPLEAAPQEVEIPTADGRTLAGMYYPSKVNPAPIVVLMHWAGGDMRDWVAIAPWLQNRPDELSLASRLARPAVQIDGPWLDPSWFPAITPEASFGALIFDYNGFGQTPYAAADDSLLQDSLAAVTFASTLEGADPNMIVAAGASIGADGAVDGCYLFNEAVAAGEAQGQCLGALSLSPGNFLTGQFTYTKATQTLTESEVVVYCLAAEDDGEAWDVCEELENLPSYRIDAIPFEYAGDLHGMMLVDPEINPIDPANGLNALQIFLEFLEAATQLPVAAE
ncbi:MAG TPA: hypothetical protein VIH14_02770 [Anaerolineales bacterium]